MKISYAKAGIFTMTVVFATICAGLAVGQALAYFENSTSPAILSLGDDEAIQAAIKEIRDELPNSRVIEINDYNKLQKTFPHYSKYLFYVGHGETSGLQVGSLLVPWEDINSIAASYRGFHQFFVSCYSDSIASTERTTFSGSVDAIIAAKISVIKVRLYETNHFTSKNALSIVEAINEILTRHNALYNGEELVIPLATESGYDLAFQKVYIRDSFFGITTREENVLYINMAPWIVNSLLFIGGLTAVMLADKIAAALVEIIGVVFGMTALLWGIVIAAVIIIAVVSLLWNMDRRGGNDAKFGLGAQYWPFPFPYLRYDNTYNKEGGDFIVPIPHPAIISVCYHVALALAFLPNKVWYGVNVF